MELILFLLILFYFLSTAVSENVYGRTGSSYTFVCPHKKTGTNNVVWNLINKSGEYISVSDGTYIPPTNPAKDRVEVVGDHSNGEFNLELSGLRESDEGTYRCIVSSEQKEYYLELLAAPSALVLYDVVDNKIRGTEGQSLTINCTGIGGKPPPALRLEIDSQIVFGKQSVHYTIHVLQRNHDNQLVKCQATSVALESPMETQAVLYLYLKPSVPVFKQDPPRTNDTQPLVVSCTSTGSRPAGVIYWKVRSTAVTVGVEQQNTHDASTDTYTVVSTLTYSVDRSYNGQSITCGVTHQTLSHFIEATKTISVYSTPSALILYNVADNKIRGTEGRSLTINCTAIGGNPEPDLRLDVGSQVVYNKQSVQYTIPVSQRNHDKQLVKCLATSDVFVSPMETKATLYLYLKPSVPVFNQDKPRTNDTQPLVVSCTSTGSRPAGVIYWKVRSTAVTVGVVRQHKHDSSTDTYTMVSTLTYNVDSSYNGQSITCGVTHQTLSHAIEATKTISVYYAPDVTVFNTTHIQTDTTRTLKCIPDGNPNIYTYYKWQHKSLYGVLIRELDGGQDGILTIPGAAESDRYQDSGEYICTVGNGIGDKDGKIKQAVPGYLTISAQPVYTLDNDDISTQYGEFGKSTNVHVHLYSVPKCTQVTWYKGNTQLPRNTKYNMTENLAPVKSSFHGVAVQLDGYDLTLTITNLVEGDFTKYRLMVSNSYGQIMQHSVLLESSKSQTSSAVIGGVTGGLLAFIVVLGVTVLVVFYLRKRGSVSRKQSTKSQRKEEAVYQNQLNSDVYEQIDGATNEIKDTSESKTEDESSNETYEPLNVRDNPNLNAELSDQDGQKQYSNTSENYEALGARNKPNVYEDFQNQKGIKEKEYVNITF